MKEGVLKGLKGPGLVFLLPMQGTRRVVLKIGDRGQLLTSRTARFGDAVVPIVSPPSAGDQVTITGFWENAVEVSVSADAGLGPPQVRDRSATPKGHRGKLSPKNFALGLLVMLLFSGACWGAYYYAYQQYVLEMTVYGGGIVTTGTVVHKRTSASRSSDGSGDTDYYIIYTFETPQGRMGKEVRVDSAFWYRVPERGPVPIRYVPGRPEMNLPDGVHLKNIYLFYIIFSGLWGTLFIIVIIGMVARQFQKVKPIVKKEAQR
jgi:hypothetical protein